MTTNTNTGVQNPATPSEGTKAQSSVMPAALGPRFCIQRDDNTVVPLIPIDELPESVVLKGVPVTLTMLEALKAKLELVPEMHPAHGVRYQLEQPINAQAMGSEQGSDSGSDGSPTSEGSESPTQKGNNNAKDQTLVREFPPFSRFILSFTMSILIFHSFRDNQPSPPMTLASLTPWQSKVPW